MSAPKSTNESNNLAGLAHVLGIITGFIAPLIIWQMKKDSDAVVTKNAKEAFNFQLTVVIAHLANFLLTFTIIWLAVSWLVTLAIWAISIWWGIVAWQTASKGGDYKYPFALRLVS